ncbi:Heat-labile enterotoxin IIA, A chain [Ophiocordyceps sinensis CO18]|uniref:Heat-labile enterotoxin IIA, A chain n=1 Tax=Ophiocordyceps sinensis (strain Co18 / CGMCC 3.14243) TaxID=911162 RepID=T5AI12_OPHSC|nr:Heat-labile enterotoxin IIA, A chain [Ophiocordyceps sinensis CO18]
MLAITFFLLLSLGRVRGAPSPAGGDTTTNTPAPPTLGFVWRGEAGGATGRTPDDIRRAGGMWARGFTTPAGELTPEQVERGSNLLAHANGGTRQYTQYVSTSTSFGAAINFAVRPAPELANEIGYLYRIRTNWAMVDVNLALGDLSAFRSQEEQAVAQGIPWSQVLGWYEVTLADLNRALGSDDPVSQLRGFIRNADFHPDATYASGAQPQLNPTHQSAAENFQTFVRDHSPRPSGEDQTTLASIDLSSTNVPDTLQTTITGGNASQAQYAVVTAAILLSYRHTNTDLKRSVLEGRLLPREETGNLNADTCARLAGGGPGGQRQAHRPVDLPSEIDDKASTVRPSVAAGICEFFGDHGCAADAFKVAYPGNDRLDDFSDGQFNDNISSFRCDGAGPPKDETQIEKPPTEPRQALETPGVLFCGNDGFRLPCTRLGYPEGGCVACEAELLAGWDERTTSVRPEEDAGECEFFGGDKHFKIALPGVDLYRDEMLKAFNDGVKSFRCDGKNKAFNPDGSRIDKPGGSSPDTPVERQRLIECAPGFEKLLVAEEPRDKPKRDGKKSAAVRRSRLQRRENQCPEIISNWGLKHGLKCGYVPGPEQAVGCTVLQQDPQDASNKYEHQINHLTISVTLSRDYWNNAGTHRHVSVVFGGNSRTMLFDDGNGHSMPGQNSGRREVKIRDVWSAGQVPLSSIRRLAFDHYFPGYIIDWSQEDAPDDFEIDTIELEATLAQPGLSKGFMLRYTEEKLGLWCGGELKRGEHRRAKISKTNEDCARDLAPGKWQIEVK